MPCRLVARERGRGRGPRGHVRNSPTMGLVGPAAAVAALPAAECSAEGQLSRSAQCGWRRSRALEKFT